MYELKEKCRQNVEENLLNIDRNGSKLLESRIANFSVQGYFAMVAIELRVWISVPNSNLSKIIQKKPKGIQKTTRALVLPEDAERGFARFEDLGKYCLSDKIIITKSLCSPMFSDKSDTNLSNLSDCSVAMYLQYRLTLSFE